MNAGESRASHENPGGEQTDDDAPLEGPLQH